MSGYDILKDLVDAKSRNLLFILGLVIFIISVVNISIISVSPWYQQILRGIGVFLMALSIFLIIINAAKVPCWLMYVMIFICVVLVILAIFVAPSSGKYVDEDATVNALSTLQADINSLHEVNNQSLSDINENLNTVSSGIAILVNALTPTPTDTPEPIGEPTPPSDMVKIEGGSVNIGTYDLGVLSSAYPKYPQVIDTFWIDKNEISNRDYLDCYEAGVCETPPISTTSFNRVSYFNNPDLDDYPVIWVSFEQALEYCQEFIGGDLPTEFQWEKAARGRDDDPYPWDGPLIHQGYSNVTFPDETPDTMQQGSYAKDRSDFGVYDMAGNVSEWTSSWYKSYPKRYPEFDNTGIYRVVRGGNFSSEYDGAMPRVYYRRGERPEHQASTIGFRCVWTPSVE